MATTPEPKTPWTVGSLSRRARRRGMILSGVVGLTTLGLSFVSHAQAKPPVTLVVAATNLPAGTVVTAADITTATMPAPGLPHALTTPPAVIGRRLTLPVEAGQPFVAADVAATPILQGVPAGDVAVMLPVSLASSDNVKPDDLVDVIWVGAGTTGTTAAGPAVPAGTVIARGLRVLAVLNQNGGPVQAPGSTGINASTPATVEVAVPAYEAGQLAVAAASGRFWLALDPWSWSQAVGSPAPGTRFVSTPTTPLRSATIPTGSRTAGPTSPATAASGAPSPAGAVSPTPSGSPPPASAPQGAG